MVSAYDNLTLFSYLTLCFLSLAWLLWLMFLILCWTGVVLVGILILLLILGRKLSDFPHVLGCWLYVINGFSSHWNAVLLYLFSSNFLSQMDVGFCHTFLLRLLRWLCDSFTLNLTFSWFSFHFVSMNFKLFSSVLTMFLTVCLNVSGRDRNLSSHNPIFFSDITHPHML